MYLFSSKVLKGFKYKKNKKFQGLGYFYLHTYSYAILNSTWCYKSLTFQKYAKCIVCKKFRYGWVEIQYKNLQDLSSLLLFYTTVAMWCQIVFPNLSYANLF